MLTIAPGKKYTGNQKAIELLHGAEPDRLQ